MNNFSYYTDTKIEYELASKRLKILQERKEEIWQKYFGIKSPQWDKITVASSYPNEDKMVLYLSEIERESNNSPSLVESIAKAESDVLWLKNAISDMEMVLAKTDTIEGKLYYLIAVKQMSVNKAIKEVAEKEYMSEKNIWKTYYPKIKDQIRKLRKGSRQG